MGIQYGCLLIKWQSCFSEIDFVLQYGTQIIPVEAKGGEDIARMER